MGPIGHTAISAGIGAGVWGITGSPAAGAATIGVGVLTDVDHLFDFYQWYIRRRKGKIFLLFHAWEYSIVGLVLLGFVFYHPFLLAAVLAHLGHVTADHFHNRLSPLGYSLAYRLAVGFDSGRIAPNHNVLDAYKAWPHMVPFGKRFKPWFKRKIEPWIESRIND